MRFNTLHRHLAILPVLYLLFCFGQQSRCIAQSVQILVSAPADMDKIDSEAFAALFRRVNTFTKISQAAISPDKPEAHIARALFEKLKMSEPDAANLQRFSLAWSLEIAPVRAQIVATIDADRKTRLGGVAHRGVPVVPPSVLGDYKKQMDVVTLRYRDTLRNSMNEAEFQRIQTDIRQMFRKNMMISGVAPNSSTTIGVAK